MRSTLRYFLLGFNTALFALVAFFLLFSVTHAAKPERHDAQISADVPADILEPAPDSSHALNWAGYVADSADSYTYVTGTWTVPAVEGSPVDDMSADATWVGIGGVHSRDLIQAGTEAIDTGNGIVYQAWYELLPGTSREIALDVEPGDSITVSILEVSKDLWQISFHNNTTGTSYSLQREYASSHSSAEWIEEMPAAVNSSLGLDMFGTVVFSSGYTIADGRSVSMEESGAEPVSMVNDAGEELATPSVIGTNGTSFAVARTDAAATPLTVAPRHRYIRDAAWERAFALGDDGITIYYAF